MRTWKSQLLTVTSLASSGLGFLSQILLARLFGTSDAVNAYFFALGVPIFVGGLLSSAVNISLTPSLRRQFRSGEAPDPLAATRSSARRLAAAVVVVGWCCIPLQLASLPAHSPLRDVPALVELLAGCWIFAGLLVHQSIAAAALVAQDRALDAALLPLFPPLFALCTMLLGAQVLGILSLLGGQILGVAMSLAMTRARFGRARDAAITRVRSRTIAAGISHGALAVACFTAYPFADSLLAPRIGPQAMAQIAYAQRLVVGLGSLMVAAPFALLATRFADLAHEGTRTEFRRVVRRSLAISMLPAIALGFAFVAAGPLIVSGLLGHGRFSAEDVDNVGHAIRLMAPGMVLMLMTTLLFRAGFALPGCARRLAWVGASWIGSYLLLGSLLKPWGLAGLASAYSLTWVVCGALTVLIIHQSSNSLPFDRHRPAAA